MRRSLLTALAALLAPAAAAETPAPFTYAQFEVSVPHLDLAACPADLAEGEVFCRVALNGDALHVYVFESGGEQRFVAMRSYYEDEFDLSLEP